jgi:hypothetical protein
MRNLSIGIVGSIVVLLGAIAFASDTDEATPAPADTSCIWEQTFEITDLGTLVTEAKVTRQADGSLVSDWTMSMPDGTLSMVTFGPWKADTTLEGDLPRALGTARFEHMVLGAGHAKQTLPFLHNGQPFGAGEYYLRFVVWDNAPWKQPAPTKAFLLDALKNGEPVYTPKEGIHRVASLVRLNLTDCTPVVAEAPAG